MNPTERSVRFFAGTIVTISLGLGVFISQYWFLLTLFAGFNLIQSSYTKWCLAEIIIKKYNWGFKKE